MVVSLRINIVLHVILTYVSSSFVVDEHHINSFIDVRDFCPGKDICHTPGTHVLCVKNPNVIGWFGPSCHYAKNVTVDQPLAIKLLNVFNAIRKRIALGEETPDKTSGVTFPRGYGLWKLQWDNELATFAQIWANQCLFNRDSCRATYRFPDPGQLLGVRRFTYPEWNKVSRRRLKEGEDPLISLINTSAIQIVKFWFKEKYKYTILNNGELQPDANTTRSGNYINMIYNEVTHVGCGISTFVDFVYTPNSANSFQNSVMLVCNFSKVHRYPNPLYKVEVMANHSRLCGCPPGSVEDTSSCLCIAVRDANACKNGQCEPHVVLLPIITVENPPEHKVPQPLNLVNGPSGEDSKDMFSYYVQPENRRRSVAVHLNRSNTMGNMIHTETVVQSSPGNRQKITIRSRYFNRSPLYPKQHYSNDSFKQHEDIASSHFKTNVDQILSRKSSIFSRSPTFSLPNRNTAVIPFQENTQLSIGLPRKVKPIVKDVAPRRNFDEAKEMLKAYLNSRRSDNHDMSYKNDPFPQNSNKEMFQYKHRWIERDTKQNDDLPFKTTAATNKTHYDYLNNKFHFDDFDINPSDNYNKTEVSSIKSYIADDNKLMKLLDNLEQEVENIKLKRNEKEVFDAKIRQIYGKILDKPSLNNIYSHFVGSPQTTIYPIQYTTTDSDYLSNDHVVPEIENTSKWYLRTGLYETERQVESNVHNTYENQQAYNTRPIIKNQDIRYDSQNRYANLRHRNVNSYRSQDSDSILDTKRRKYFQEKLDMLEKKLKNTRMNLHRYDNDNTLAVRPIVTSSHDNEKENKESGSKNKLEDPIYVPGRARPLYGF